MNQKTAKMLRRAGGPAGARDFKRNWNKLPRASRRAIRKLLSK